MTSGRNDLPTTTDVSAPFLVPCDGPDDELLETVHALLNSSQLTQLKLAELIGVKPSHLSRWLNKDAKKRGAQLPIWALQRLCKEVNRYPVIALVDRSLYAPEKLSEYRISRRLIRRFFLGMGFITMDPKELARHWAKVWGASSWCLYREDEKRNILEWHGDKDLLNYPELLTGPSWASELPMQLVQDLVIKKKTTDSPAKGKYRIEKKDWTDPSNRSAFADRENVKYTVGVAIQDAGVRATVLFLNFKEQPPKATVEEISLLPEVIQLRAFVHHAWALSPATGAMEKGASNLIGAVLDLIHEAFSSRTGDTLGDALPSKVEKICQLRWASSNQTCSVFALDECVQCLDKNPDVVVFANSESPADLMVRRAAANGESFYVEDMSRQGLRAEFDPMQQLPAALVQRLVIPIRCEDHLAAETTGEPRELRKKHWVTSFPPSRKARSWGALAIDSDERFLSPAGALELSVVTHVAACGLYLKRLSSQRPEYKSFFDNVFKAARETAKGIRDWEENKRGGPLDTFCRRVVEDHLCGDAERCDIWPYDYGREKFRQGGAFTSHGWSAVIDDLCKGRQVEYLTPRKGGNSERMLGVLDECHLIAEVQNQTDVSPVTRMIETSSLVGCSCRIGGSFKSDAVMWLGFRKASLKQDFLNENNLMKLRVVAHVAALFSVTLRWWGSIFSELDASH